MIRLDIDVLWVVIGFAERSMGFFMMVKGHIKEINDYEFGVNSNFLNSRRKPDMGILVVC